MWCRNPSFKTINTAKLPLFSRGLNGVGRYKKGSTNCGHWCIQCKYNLLPDRGGRWKVMRFPFGSCCKIQSKIFLASINLGSFHFYCESYIVVRLVWFQHNFKMWLWGNMKTPTMAKTNKLLLDLRIRIYFHLTQQRTSNDVKWLRLRKSLFPAIKFMKWVKSLSCPNKSIKPQPGGD